MPLRLAAKDDVPALRVLYEAAVRSAGPASYSAAQVETWAAFARMDSFGPWIMEVETLVDVRDGQVVGFAGLAPSGHVTSLYAHPDWMRQGIASGLLRELIGRASRRGISELWTEASELSRPVFRRFGFELGEIEVVDRRGVRFQRYRMHRRLSAL